MASENEIATLAGRNEKADSIKQVTEPVLPYGQDIKNDSTYPPNQSSHNNPIGTRLGSLIRMFEQQLVEYNFEARGIERVAPDERMKKLSWVSYLQAFLLWVSINLAANNVTLGMLGPAVYGLSFRDSSLCAFFGCFVGALVASWMATWGPISGIRTMVGGKALTHSGFLNLQIHRHSGDTPWVGGLAKSLSYSTSFK